MGTVRWIFKSGKYNFEVLRYNCILKSARLFRLLDISGIKKYIYGCF